ncbi:unnamed protein product [Linum tenue]|uniref:Cytochrome P450 n=1 Tax=Linum tenue TaxID=586396 RepID=A0AAV0J198_9ROSI|nr:unnamed protein product [Linum tenue]
MAHFVFVLLFLLLAPAIVLVLLLRNRRQSLRLPPGPKPWPVIGNLLQIGPMPHATFARLAQTHGPLISLRIGTQLLVVGSSPDAATAILKTHDHHLSGRSVPHVSFARDPDLNRDSIAWSTHCSDQWRSLRSLVRTELFSTKVVAEDGRQSMIREDKAHDMTSFLSKNRGEEVRIRELVFKFTFNALANVYMSADLIGDEWAPSRVVRDMMELHGALNISDLYPALGFLDLQGLRKRTAECVSKLRELWDPIVFRRNNSSGSISSTSDFLDVLLDSGFSDKQISYTFVELLAAVSDTTSATMEWAMSELIANPKTLTACRQELDDKFPKGHTVKESDLAQLPYLRACVKETLRLHPPAPLLLPRRAAKDCHVMGYTVPKDAQVLVNVWAVARDPRYWEEPLRFKPERFVEGGSESDVDYKGNHFEYLPFGSGRRICSGLPMAMRKVQLAVATLVHGFEWSLPAGMVAEDLDMDEKYGVTLMKLNPLVLIPTPRD